MILSKNSDFMSDFRTPNTSQLILILVSVLFFCSCEGEECNSVVPYCGEATYEVSFSKDLRDDQAFGAFLPHNVICTFDSANIKMEASAPLSLARTSFVVSNDESFATVEFDNAKLLISLNDLFGDLFSDQAQDNVVITVSDELVDISGYMSTHVFVTPKDDNSGSVSIDFFYIPFGAKKSVGCTDNKLIQPSQWLRLPGLMTAMNAKLGDSNIMLVIKDFKEKESVKHDVFTRPFGFVEASRRDVIAIMDLMMN